MKLPAYSRYDQLLQAMVVPIYVAVTNWILIGPMYWQDWVTFGLATVLTLMITISAWYANNYLSIQLDNSRSESVSYILWVFNRSSAVFLTSGGHTLILYGMFWLIDLPHFQLNAVRLLFALLFTFCIVVFTVITYKSIHTIDDLQESKQQVKTLSQAQLQAELNALRQQVNPHFLFNSLNSLTALIGEDPAKAEAFSEELSTVYRYLLRANEAPLVPLASELDFLNSYYHLLKTRHGDSLTLVRQVLPGTEERQLPPLTLQLLIENAVKHNIILPDQPLTIYLQTDDTNRLVVSNNIQRKATRALSNGVGLSNILSKYQMLGQPTPTIEDDGIEFRVTVRLI